MRACVHFVGFRGDEYLSAVKVWGKPDYYHLGWDRRSRREIAPGDTVVFAKGEHDQPYAARNFDDLAPPPRSMRKDMDMDEWRPIDTAPKDGSYILAIVAKNESRHLGHLAGRVFVIRHEGRASSGYDMGWAVFPGYGGASDALFSCWTPLPLPHKAPAHER